MERLALREISAYTSTAAGALGVGWAWQPPPYSHHANLASGLIAFSSSLFPPASKSALVIPREVLIYGQTFEGSILEISVWFPMWPVLISRTGRELLWCTVRGAGLEASCSLT